MQRSSHSPPSSSHHSSPPGVTTYPVSPARSPQPAFPRLVTGAFPVPFSCEPSAASFQALLPFLFGSPPARFHAGFAFTASPSQPWDWFRGGEEAARLRAELGMEPSLNAPLTRGHLPFQDKPSSPSGDLVKVSNVKTPLAECKISKCNMFISGSCGLHVFIIS